MKKHQSNTYPTLYGCSSFKVTRRCGGFWGFEILDQGILREGFLSSFWQPTIHYYTFVKVVLFIWALFRLMGTFQNVKLGLHSHTRGSPSFLSPSTLETNTNSLNFSFVLISDKMMKSIYM